VFLLTGNVVIETFNLLFKIKTLTLLAINFKEYYIKLHNEVNKLVRNKKFAFFKIYH
jgi:hypothetical protein